MTAPFVIEPLSKAHDRSGFASGNDRVDAYFRQTVSQDVKRRYAACFVAREVATGRVGGFYTLSSNSVPLTDLLDVLAKKLPRYPTVPAALLGWMGRDEAFRGQGLGEVLVFDAIRTVASAAIASHAIFADAIDERAATFYADLGFMPLIDKPMRLFLPIATGLTVLNRGGA
ncbi:GNAT family N-acetyltransferase [Methylobacterium sp. E-066]|uniref:GNAT family N-acetyltransferase n=1 Tax=Methylobacterium sp. E-066 TaxID=2836584 RepID=UPI001FB88802|nr:GNAT family N-acetyltransferase [Methylobacterium sp. E-066]MCJ2139923.1 GNAT family N-acetyltransferase [Methylobacterium sp. E-066]